VGVILGVATVYQWVLGSNWESQMDVKLLLAGVVQVGLQVPTPSPWAVWYSPGPPAGYPYHR